jgi:hypothetical protein
MALVHLPPGAPVPGRLRGVPHHVVRTPELRALPYPRKIGGPGWDLWHDGHTDLILLHFWRANPRFDRYWAIEYDVAFSGPWRRLFAAFEEDESDLLAPLIARRRDYPDWLFWSSLAPPPDQAPPDDARALCSFMPIFRASDRLVRAVDEAYRAGWGGHVECSWATMAELRGLAVADLGGHGDLTAERNRGRFYTGTLRDMYRAPGTLVFKPTLHRAGSRPDMLWHPVKPFWARVELRQALLGARSVIGRALRTRAPWLVPARWREPGSFSRPRRPIPPKVAGAE